MPITKYSQASPEARYANLLRRVRSELGIRKSYVQNHLLPDWWSEEVVKSDTGFLETGRLLARALGVSVEAALSDTLELKAADARFACKSAAGVEVENFAATRIVAQTLATLALRISPVGSEPAESAAALRGRILEIGGRVDLRNVLDAAWSIGVPIVHLHEAPGRKPHGFVFRLEDRYAIVLSRNMRHSGWLVFDALHELGHVCLGHLSEADVWIDEIDSSDSDEKEAEANAFAVSALTGGTTLPPPINLATSWQAARTAKIRGEELRTDPQWLIVASGNRKSSWPEVQRTLADRWPDDDATRLINEKMVEHGCTDRLARNEVELLGRLTGAEIA